MKIKKETISTLWVFIMMNMLYADILSFMNPEFLKQVLTGYAGEVMITPLLLLTAAIALEIPIGMIFLSRILKGNKGRWANIIAGILTIAFITAGGSIDPHYIFIGSIEVLCLLFIIVKAWKKEIIE